MATIVRAAAKTLREMRRTEAVVRLGDIQRRVDDPFVEFEIDAYKDKLASGDEYPFAYLYAWRPFMSSDAATCCCRQERAMSEAALLVETVGTLADDLPKLTGDGWPEFSAQLWTLLDRLEDPAADAVAAAKALIALFRKYPDAYKALVAARAATVAIRGKSKTTAPAPPVTRYVELELVYATDRERGTGATPPSSTVANVEARRSSSAGPRSAFRTITKRPCLKHRRSGSCSSAPIRRNTWCS